MKRVLCFFSLLLVGLLLASPLAAQESISINPTALTVTGTRGEMLSRTLLIRPDTALTGVQIIALDLIDAETGLTLPAAAIHVSAGPTNVAAGALLSVEVQFDLSQVAAGRYGGDILLSYAGGSRAVPVTVSAKDQPWFPLVALVAGVALGVGVSTYRSRGRPRDEVMVRLGQIRTQMKVDEELSDLGLPFTRRIEAALADVEVALEGQQWDQAREAIEGANAVWMRWRRGRPDWIEQLKAYAHLVERLKALSAGSYYIAELLQAAEDIHRGIPDLDEPQTFREALEPLMKKTNTYLELQARLDMLDHAGPRGSVQSEVLERQLQRLSPMEDASTEQIEALREQIETALLKLRKSQLLNLVSELERHQPDGAGEVTADLRERIDALAPGADNAYFELHTDLSGALQRAMQPTTEDVHLESAFATPLGMGQADMPKGAAAAFGAQLMATLPGVRVRSLEQAAVAAGQRLRWFMWLTYFITVVLLALAGFVELYSTRANFGSNGLGDYFALLAWGFGAEATRSAIADMVQSWGIVRR